MRTLTAALLLCLSVTLTLGQQQPAPYKLPQGAAFTEANVSIPVAGDTDETGWEIAGTLNVPTGEAPAGGWPAVLFISGSGSQTRHGIQGPMDLGSWQIMDAVAGAGFVVLRTDDRGVGGTPLGPKGIKPEDVGYLDLVSDARTALRWLAGRKEVNAAKVFVMGHSEGGTTAPLLASEGEKIAGIVSLAGPGRNLYDVIYMQVENANAARPKAEREAVMRVQKEFQDAVKENRIPNPLVVPASIWTQTAAGRKWMREHFNLDTEGMLAKVACPVYVANGAADFQVNADADARPLARKLIAGKCNDVTMRIYDDLDHLFKPCGGRESSMQMYLEKRDVDAVFIRDVVAWLTARK